MVDPSRVPAPAAKLGLALSGGGFRAAFFHVGVLARLAEFGLMRKVEVISTVSGGSIVGALYYVLLNRRLKQHGQLDHDQYCELVKEVETRLLQAVRRNIRARLLANLFKNLRMALPSYSRSDRAGDLYDRYLYKGAWGAEGRPRKWWGGQRQIELRELVITAGPHLVVNATTLNTGHNWRFETERMGEPLPAEPELARVVQDVDKNARLMEGNFDPGFGNPVVPDRQRDFPLGLAVAASAAVPGLFHPLSITGMYQGIRVQLVDGGVQDNQGVQSLFDQGCTHLIVSDASRQLDDSERPSTRIPGVAKRSLSIANDRLRDEQLVHMATRQDTAACAVMHLRKGLEGKRVPPGASLDQAEEERAGRFSCQDFGVHPEVQEALAKVRTDLDLFSDHEALSLALDGYLMTDYEVPLHPPLVELAAEGEPHNVRWAFCGVDKLIGEPLAGSYGRHLRAGKHRFVRALFLFPEWPAVLLVLGAFVVFGSAGVGIAVLIGDGALETLEDAWPVWIIVSLLAGLGLIGGLYAATNFKSALLRAPVDFIAGMLLPLVLALPAFLWAWLQLLARPLSLRLGQVEVSDDPGGASDRPTTAR